MQIAQRGSGVVCAMSFTSLIPFWAVKGTEPSESAVMWFLYGALGASALIWVLATFFRWRESKHKKISTVEKLPLDARLQLARDRARALAGQMHEFASEVTLEPARVWRSEVYGMLRAGRTDLAQRFLDETEEIPQITDQALMPARFILEDQIKCLEEIIQELERTRSLAVARKRGLRALSRS